MENGHRKALDLTDFTEMAHIKIGEIEFEIPLDLPLRLQQRWQRTFKEMDERSADLTDEQVARYEDTLWEIADEILARAVPRPEKPAREILNISALLKLTAFLLDGYNSIQRSMSASPSPTPTAAPSG
jgi:hypothetical protein